MRRTDTVGTLRELAGKLPVASSGEPLHAVPRKTTAATIHVTGNCTAGKIVRVEKREKTERSLFVLSVFSISLEGGSQTEDPDAPDAVAASGYSVVDFHYGKPEDIRTQRATEDLERGSDSHGIVAGAAIPAQDRVLIPYHTDIIPERALNGRKTLGHPVHAGGHDREPDLSGCYPDLRTDQAIQLGAPGRRIDGGYRGIETFVTPI
jgi:hypothetical protein